MTVWVTADQHFGHKNIIRLCGRSFGSVEEMDAEMERAWNEVVRPGDTVYHLGDFAFRNAYAPGALLERLNGEKHLIKGNHDPKQDARQWASVRDYLELEHGGVGVVMSHYAMEDWVGIFRGAVMLHGHSHGKTRKIPGRLDVGVDSVGYTPLTLTAAIELAGKPEP